MYRVISIRQSNLLEHQNFMENHFVPREDDVDLWTMVERFVLSNVQCEND